MLAEEYAVDSNLADIITESFGTCESDVTKAFAQQISAVREQAAAQGITYVVSSGDQGGMVQAEDADKKRTIIVTVGTSAEGTQANVMAVEK